MKKYIIIALIFINLIAIGYIQNRAENYFNEKLKELSKEQKRKLKELSKEQKEKIEKCETYKVGYDKYMELAKDVLDEEKVYLEAEKILKQQENYDNMRKKLLKSLR